MGRQQTVQAVSASEIGNDPTAAGHWVGHTDAVRNSPDNDGRGLARFKRFDQR